MPVSVFPVGGILRTMGTSRLEKRKICATAPTWIAEKCS